MSLALALLTLQTASLQTAPAAPSAPQEAPADLGPAMKPYLGCLLGSRGMDVHDVGTTAFPPARPTRRLHPHAPRFISNPAH